MPLPRSSPRWQPGSLLRLLRSLGLLSAAVAATLALWLAASPPATSTVAPAALGQP